jgi:hypothetical protein
MSLRWADHKARGVLQTVVRRCVWSRNLVIEEDLAYWGLLSSPPPKKNQITYVVNYYDCYLRQICITSMENNSFNKHAVFTTEFVIISLFNLVIDQMIKVLY